MSALAPAAVAAAFSILLAVVLVLIIQRRHRHQMVALMERLGELEERRSAEPDTNSDGLRSPADTNGEAEAAPGDTGESLPPTGDVLAGRTSYVRRVVDGSAGEAASLADQAVACIHGHLEENVTPGQVAEELYVSLRTLERGLAVTLACTPSQLILAMKMREARRMLLSGSYRVNEVAYRLGFTNPSHFSKRFKSFYRKSPSDYVRRSAGEANPSG